MHAQLLDSEPLLFHGEVLFRNGKAVGDVRAASYGHTLGGAVALAHLRLDEDDPEFVTKKYVTGSDAQWEISVAGHKYPALVSLSPLYDPKNLRIKAEDGS